MKVALILICRILGLFFGAIAIGSILNGFFEMNLGYRGNSIPSDTVSMAILVALAVVLSAVGFVLQRREIKR